MSRKKCTCAVKKTVEKTVTGMGFELSSFKEEKSNCFYIKLKSCTSEKPITLQDCVKVTKQLEKVLTVEKFHFNLLEVSSPGS